MLTDMRCPVDPDPDVAEKYPEMAAKWRSFHKSFKCVPAVCGQTCAFLSTGRGKVLRGRYFDCEQDIGTVVSAGPEALKELYELKVDFLGGLPNDGGTALGVVEKN
jgi:putative intracellular protease/amidase